MNPESEPPSESNLRFWRRTFFVSLGMIVIPLLLGVGGTAFGMLRAYQTLGATGGGDPKELAHAISITLMTTAAGLVIVIPGLILFVICLVRYSRLRKYKKLAAS